MNGISIEPVTADSPQKPEWRSCCLTVNPSAVKYFVQISILISLIVYSATMLIVDNRCESQRNYGGLLML